MRLTTRKILTWLVVSVLSFNPMLGALAIEADPGAATDCQIVLPANSAADNVNHDHIEDCSQLHACNSYCQLAPLQPADLSQIHISRRPLSAFPGESENLVTRFVEGIERPPRV